MKKLQFFTINIFLYFSIFNSNEVSATTPSEMADLSLQELFSLSTDDIVPSNDNLWQVGFMYKWVRLKGFKEGNSNISNKDILFVPSLNSRTDRNFPVLPTLITQKVAIGSLSYAINKNSNVSINVSYIEQSTDHISIVPGYGLFTIGSSGLGDITLNYSNVFLRKDNQQWSYSIGLSAPTGSIDEEGDTPRAPDDQQLPFTMQLGSGTWDIPMGLSYQNNSDVWLWGANILSKIRLGKNKRNYTLGDRIAFTTWIKWRVNKYFSPFFKLIYQNWGTIDGRDEDTTVSGPFPFPAGITNPKFFGGEKINTTIGTDVLWKDHYLTFDFNIPVYQNLNGIQPKENFNLNVSWNTRF